jgi:uncharacterized protein
VSDGKASVKLRRGRYVHAAFDKIKGTWVYQNLINRALIEADHDENQAIYKFLNDPNSLPGSDHESAILELLIDSRFIVEEDIDEVAILEKRFIQRKRDNSFGSLSIVTTLQCNLRCEYCYQEHVDQAITQEDEEKIVGLIRRNIAHGQNSGVPLTRFGISWWGGEPLLGIGTIERLSERIIPIFDQAKITYYAQTSTNGVLLTKANCETLRRAKLERFQITIDGPKSLHDLQRFNVGRGGTYESILRGLYNLLDVFHDKGRFVVLRVNVTPRMKDMLDSWEGFIEDLKPAASHLGLHVHKAIPNEFFEEKNSLKNAEYGLLYDHIQKLLTNAGFYCLGDRKGLQPATLYCGAIPDNNWIILPGGRVTKCNEGFHDSSSDCGRLLDGGKLELFPKADDWLKYSPFESEVCRSCSVLPVCMGGCRIVPFGALHVDRCGRKTFIESAILANPKRFEQSA